MTAMSLAGRTLFITGASRGIGEAIALRAARDGANIAVIAKTAEAHPKLPGTIFTTAEAIEKAGGKALPIQCDIRDEAAVQQAVEATVARFGGIDICVNNASAISLTPTALTEPKRFDLMFGINTRGSYTVTRACLPYLQRGTNPHVLMLSPPLDLRPKWFAPHVAYSIAKYGMSLCVLGFAEEFRGAGIAVNALWPRTTIATSAVKFAISDKLMEMSRTPDILAECAYRIFNKNARDFTGQFLIDDTFLYGEGVRDFDQYRVDASQKLAPDFFVPDDIPAPPGVAETILAM
jgi:citronellol/citronellal dehydrogenase